MRCARYFLAHLPADHVPFWDMAFGSEDGGGGITTALIGEVEDARRDAGLKERIELYRLVDLGTSIITLSGGEPPLCAAE